ncbi:hypothetical protein VKT23_015997 [Stygiomarasmius scandens]|uniref:NACHT domain-containing protein n=1 Tax=Marasmiellus scandens TaxID=2682957 RepID=A0ABR1IZA8_9AGAR
MSTAVTNEKVEGNGYVRSRPVDTLSSTPFERTEETTPSYNVTIKGIGVHGDKPTGTRVALRYGNRFLEIVKLAGDDLVNLDVNVFHTINADIILFELYQLESHKFLRKFGSATVTIQSLAEAGKRGKNEVTETVVTDQTTHSLQLKVEFSIKAIEVPQMTTCKCSTGSTKPRNLVVCIDGTANQFSLKNTNVVELYSRLVKDDTQLTYYNSGIGTYVKDSWASPSYWKQLTSHTIDMGIAWNFKKIVLSAYEWLSENYRDGDRIFFFGFSRGAYQVRVLAGMIEKVGLLHKGNKDQIPFAYELYLATTQIKKPTSDKNANLKDGKGPENSKDSQDANGQKTSSNVDSKQQKDNKGTTSDGNANRKDGKRPDSQNAKVKDPEQLSKTFKRTLSRSNVKVHFVGAWDTVSSIGVVRGPSLPETTTGMTHVCYFRHALALDERRVKFLPEYANGSRGPPFGDNRVKEVWFAGSHSDIGGGNTLNPDLNKFGPALRWMSYEAISHGLKMEAYRGEWEPLKPQESLNWFWWILELLPIAWLLYKAGESMGSETTKQNKESTVWRPHSGRSRLVQPGQLIHESVLKDRQPEENTTRREYTPKAYIHNDISWDQKTLKERKMLEPDIYAEAEYAFGQLHKADYILNETLVNIFETLSQSSVGQRSMTEYPDAINLLLVALDAELKDNKMRSKMLDVLLMALSAFPPLPKDPVYDGTSTQLERLFRRVVQQNRTKSAAVFKVLRNMKREPLELEEKLFNDLAKIYPEARITWFTVSSAYEALKARNENDTNLMDLCNTMTATYLTAIKDAPNGAGDLLGAMLKLSTECSLFISHYTSSSRRYSDQPFDRSGKVEKFKAVLGAYSDQFTMAGSASEVNTAVPDVRAPLVEVRTGMGLEVAEDGLEPLKLSGSLLEPRSHCLNGTRRESLKKIIDWIARGQESILWLSGVAGCGKSALMGSLYDVLNELGCNSRLAAFVRFDRNEFNDPHLFIGALVRRLVSFDGRLGQAIIDVVQQRSDIAEVRKMSEQLESLVLGPLNKCRTEMQREGPIAIVIDGLDECMQNDRESFSELLQLFTNNLFAPFPHVRIIIASRPEYAIRKAFTTKDHIHHFPLDITSSETQADIRFFLEHEFSEKRKLQSVASDDLDKLAQRASGLFIWARVTVDFIADDPENRLPEVIKADPPADALNALTILYHTALDSVVDEKGDESGKTDIHLVLAIIMATNQVCSMGLISLPLPPSSALQGWINHHPSTCSGQINVSDLLDKLQSVLLEDKNGGWSLLHKSFDDFLTDQSRCGDWFIDVKDHIKSLASISTSIITSFVANPTVGDIDDAFCYASYYCIPFWCALGSAEGQLLSNMLRRYFLRWICIAFLHGVGVTNDILWFCIYLLNNINGQLPSHFNVILFPIRTLCGQGPGQKTSSQFIKFFFHYLCTAHLKGHNALFQCYMPVYVQLAGGSTNYTDIEAAIGAAIEKDPTWMPPVLADDVDDFLGETGGIPEEIEDDLLEEVMWHRLK